MNSNQARGHLRHFGALRANRWVQAILLGAALVWLGLRRTAVVAVLLACGFAGVLAALAGLPLPR